jgi:hypothetical protein
LYRRSSKAYRVHRLIISERVDCFKAIYDELFRLVRNEFRNDLPAILTSLVVSPERSEVCYNLGKIGRVLRKCGYGGESLSDKKLWTPIWHVVFSHTVYLLDRRCILYRSSEGVVSSYYNRFTFMLIKNKRELLETTMIPDLIIADLHNDPTDQQNRH